MGNASNLPLRLYRANIELQLRVARLVQEHGQQWLELGTSALSDGISESDAEVRRLLDNQDWQSLAALPAETFWRQLQRHVGGGQAAAQVAVNAHNAFADGLVGTLKDWQEETAAAVAGATLPGELDAAWKQVAAPWEQFLAAFAPPVASAKKGGSRTRGD